MMYISKVIGPPFDFLINDLRFFLIIWDYWAGPYYLIKIIGIHYIIVDWPTGVTQLFMDVMDFSLNVNFYWPKCANKVQ